MASYNRTRHAEDLLEKNASQPPSFSVHLRPEHWTLNNVSTKFLYNTQISCLLDDIRAHRIPVDFLDLFDAVKVPFYDGCMIVELLDYRPQQRNKETQPDRPEKTRVVLHPNAETLFADICSLNRKNGNKWTDRDALEVEARLLLATSPPLCLAPDPHLTRVANHVLRVSTPTVPISLKRKAAAMDPEEDEIEKARRTKIMQFMTPRPGRTHSQNYRILETIQRSRQPRDHKPPTPSVPAAEPMPQPSNTSSYPSASVEKLKKQQNRPGTPKSMFSNGSTHTSATQTPSPTHMFANMQPVASSMDSKRAPTPQHHQYAPSPPSIPPSQSQPPAQVHPNPQTRPPSTVPSFQPPIPNPQFLNQPPPGRNTNTQGKAPHPNKPAQPTAPQPTPTQAQRFYAQQQQQALLMQHRLAQQHQQQPPQQQPPQQQPQQNGRSTPRPTISNGQANIAAAMAASRGSPLAPNQRIGTRSPANQNPSQPPNPQMPTHNHPPPQLNFAYHAPPHLRPTPPNGHVGSPRPPQALPSHLAAARASPSPVPSGNAAPQAAVEGGQPMPMPSQQQPQQPQQQQYQMYYPNVFMPSAGRMPNGYPAWAPMMMGRGGMAGASGHGPGMQMTMPMQPIMPGGQPHQLQHHQVPVGGGGEGQPGLPGR
ncbi:Spt20 family-domain-containing protein [Mycena haematopus]|nr:Spt20 family-domain-containing protein [Mycena haematopus]